MSETNEMEVPKTWLPKFTVREAFAVIVFCVGIGGWISTQRYITSDLGRQITELRSDVQKLEERANEKDKSDNAADKMISILEYRLAQIEGKLTSIDTNMKRMAQ